MIDVFTDGACSGNPGPGGWGVLIVEGERCEELCGGEGETTNNRMEMLAVIEALKATAERGAIRLHTDSQYVKNGVNEWMPNWKRNGWRTASRKPVKNQDLWREIDALTDGREIEWRWARSRPVKRRGLFSLASAA